jgi:glycosyltransferase involved in cell wall biosynthesis
MAGAGMCTSNSALMAVIDEMGLRAQVTLLGHMDDVRGVLNAADIVVSASLGEASSNVVAEAMAVGATCIVTNVGESARLVGSFGVVLADSAPGSIAQAVLEVLAQERVAWRRRAFLASEHIRENYSLRQTVDTYDRLYQSVNGEQGCQAGA